MKIPKSLALCADKLWEVRQERLRMQKEVDKLAKDEAELREHLIEHLPKSQAEGISGKKGHVRVVRKQVPKLADPTKFYNYVHRQKAFDLLPKQVNRSAVQERWEAGKKVPGVEPFQTVTLSVTQAK